MNYRLGLLLSCLPCTASLSAQSLLPTHEEAPEWTVRTESYATGELETYFTNYYLTGAVDGCGETWQVLWEDPPFLAEDREVGYYTERDERVYFRLDLDCDEEERLLYDFSAEVGALVPILETHPVWGDTLIHYEVFEKGTACYGGVERRFSRVGFELGEPGDFEYDWYFTYWVEGIGDLIHPFKSLDCVSLNDNFCDTQVRLQCLSTGSAVRYSDGEAAACAYDLTHLTRLHVDAAVPPFVPTDGARWDCAFRTLGEALAVADPGDSIWVAAGTYVPSATADRSESFHVPNGVKLYGGFSGTETALAQRDWLGQITTLSGEIGDTAARADNSYHVLTFLGNDTTTLIDGFTITRGYADEPVPTNGDNWRGAGALLLTDAAHPTVAPRFRNCRFSDHHARSYGGAVYCLSENDRVALPTFINCDFSRNDAFFAGAVYQSGPVPAERELLFRDCRFTDNTAAECAAVYLEGASGTARFARCDFTGGRAISGSGALQYVSGDSIVHLAIDSCTFTANEGAIGGAILLVSTPSTSAFFPTVDLRVTDSRFTDNVSTSGESGGIMVGSSRDSMRVTIQNSEFTGNVGADKGGALTIFNNVGATTALAIDQCLFQENIGGEPAGGAVYLFTNLATPPSLFTTHLTNSILINNRGAFAMAPGKAGRVELRMQNCTTYDNGQYALAKTWGPTFDSIDNRAQAYLDNNIFWETETVLPRLFYNGSPDIENIRLYHLRHNLIYAESCDAEGCEEADLGGNQFTTEDNAPLFLDVENDDFRLRACSPAVNAGYTPATLAAGLTEDFAHAPRILEDSVDLGAYERLSFLLTDYTTITSASGSAVNDGGIRVDSLQGGTPPFEFTWEDGSGASERNDLLPGTYFLTVTDAEGCAQTFAYTVDVMVNTFDSGTPAPPVVFPNPLPAGTNLELQNGNSLHTLALYDNTGRLLWQGPPAGLAAAGRRLPVGTFLLSGLGADGAVFRWRIVVV